MSTNYYWASEPVLLPTGVEVSLDTEDPAIHIGKRSGGRFIWAQPPAQVGAVCRLRPAEALIQSEYGERLTCAEFLDLIADEPADTGSIGGWFF